MDRFIARFIAYISCALAVALTGCASVSYTPGAGVDVDRLNNAIATDDVHFVRGAIESREITPNQRIVTPGYSGGAPLLAIAARSASLNVMAYLISAGADLNGRTAVGETPLMLAAFFSDEAEGGRGGERHERAVRMLIGAGADIENLPHHYTALAYAAYQGKERIARFLIERGASVNGDARAGLTYINTPLMMAAIQGHEGVARLLLKSGADADVRVHNGHTAAEFATKYNHRQLAQMLQCAQRQHARNPSQCGQLLGFAVSGER